MARRRPELDERFRRSKLHRYLLADENVIVAQRQHWASVAVPVGSAVAGLVAVVTLNVFLPPSLLTDLLWWAMLALAVWAGSQWFLWRHNWLLATDKRVMVNYGLLHQGVAMFSLSRVPDLTYTRSTLGQLLGYGELEREGTGAGQTLHKVRFVEHPHATYTTICAAIFELQDRMFGMDEDENGHRFEDGPPQHTPGLYSGYVPPEERVLPADLQHESDQDESDQHESDQDGESPGVVIEYGVSLGGDRDSNDPWQQSPDLQGSETGPIPYRRSTDEGGSWRPTTDERQ